MFTGDDPFNSNDIKCELITYAMQKDETIERLIPSFRDSTEATVIL